MKLKLVSKNQYCRLMPRKKLIRYSERKKNRNIKKQKGNLQQSLQNLRQESDNAYECSMQCTYDMNREFYFRMQKIFFVFHFPFGHKRTFPRRAPNL